MRRTIRSVGVAQSGFEPRQGEGSVLHPAEEEPNQFEQEAGQQRQNDQEYQIGNEPDCSGAERRQWPQQDGGQAVADGAGPGEEVQHVVEVEITGDQCQQERHYPEGAVQPQPQLFRAHDLDGADLDGADPGPITLVQRRTDQPERPAPKPEREREDERGRQRLSRLGPEDTALAVVAESLDGLGHASPVHLGQDRAADTFQARVGIQHRKDPAAAGDHLATQRCLLNQQRLGREAPIRGQCLDPAGDLPGPPLRREGGDAAHPEQGDTVQDDRYCDLFEGFRGRGRLGRLLGPDRRVPGHQRERELEEAEERAPRDHGFTRLL